MKQEIISLGNVLFKEYSYEQLGNVIVDFFNKHEFDRLYVVVPPRTEDLQDLLLKNTDVNDFENLKYALMGDIYFSKYEKPDYSSAILDCAIQSAWNIYENVSIGNVHVIDQNSPSYPIVANGGYLNANVDLAATSVNSDYSSCLDGIILISGFGARNSNHEKVLLGNDANAKISAGLAYVLDNFLQEEIR